MSRSFAGKGTVFLVDEAQALEGRGPNTIEIMCGGTSTHVHTDAFAREGGTADRTSTDNAQAAALLSRHLVY